MSNHMLFMSFGGKNLYKIFISLNLFFGYLFTILANKETVHFCYVGTASSDSKPERFFFYIFLRIKFGNRLRFSHLKLNSYTTKNFIQAQLKEQDVIFIGPGNTKKMLQVWDKSGFTHILNGLKANKKLPILAGVSAGSMFPFHSGITDSTGEYKAIKCLQWFKYSFCPHANSLDFVDYQVHRDRLSAFREAIELGKIPAGYAISDGCMLHFYNNKLVRAFSTFDNQYYAYVNSNILKRIKTIKLTTHNIMQNVNATLKCLGYPPVSITQPGSINCNIESKPQWYILFFNKTISYLFSPVLLGLKQGHILIAFFLYYMFHHSL